MYIDEGKAVVTEIEEEDQWKEVSVSGGANETIYSHYASTSKPVQHKLLIPFTQTVPCEM